MYSKQIKWMLAALTVTFCVPYSSVWADGASEKLRDKLREKEVEFEQDLIDEQIRSILNIKGGVGIEVMPNRDKKTYTRFERSELSLSLGKNIGKDLVLSSKIQEGIEVEFARQFDKQSAALNIVKTPPYNPATKLPLGAEKALALKVGDYVRFKARLAGQVGAGLAKSFGVGSVGVHKSFLMIGDFQLELYRKSDKRILFRASALKQEGTSGGLKSKTKLSFDVLPISELNEEIEEIFIPDNPFKMNRKSNNGNLYLVAYEFDLSNPAAQKAFNELLSPQSWTFKTFKIANPWRSGGEIQKALLVNFKGIEDLVEKDKELPRDERRVTRVNRGRSEFERTGLNMEIDFKIFGFNNGHSYVGQFFTLQTKQNQPVAKYLLGDYRETKGSSFGFGLFEDEVERNATALFRLDNKKKIREFVELGMTYSRDDNKFNFKEKEKLNQILHTVLPKNLHNHIDLSKIDPNFWKKNARMDLELVFHKEALTAVGKRLSRAEIYDVTLDFAKQVLESHNGKYKRVRPGRHSGLKGRDNIPYRPLRRFKYDLEELQWKLPSSLAYNSALTFEERWENFLSLKKNALFRQIGPGILTRLVVEAAVNQKEVWDFMSFRFSMKTRDMDEAIEIVLGDKGRSDAYKSLLSAKRRLQKRRHDPSYNN